MAETVVSKKTYVVVWAVLMCLTALTGAISFINLGEWSTVVAIAIACGKASLVIAFFMHLWYEKQKTIWIWATVSVFWLTLLFVLTMNDYVTRGFLRVPGK
ncbi:MAG TPA: cytochrome C oxidase subunit IV family protein [Candidatus Sulfotelmatobacter sp.]|nr:cytochrome C oxidase subunit IV family protein [Candidatus Sulfotelmatobacter sp.]